MHTKKCEGKMKVVRTGCVCVYGMCDQEWKGFGANPGGQSHMGVQEKQSKVHFRLCVLW